jgi:methyl-accepting chemotaxis protein
MKLAGKLLVAPLLIAAVALGTGAFNSVVTQREAAVAAAHFESDIDSLKAASAAQQKLAEIHASVYRTQAIIDSLDAAKVKAFRQGVGEGLKQVQGEVAALAATAAGDEALGLGIGAAAMLIEKYRAQADKAIELTSVEANMGVAAMRSAELTFGELAKTMAQVRQRKEVLRAEYMAEARQHALWLTLLLGGVGALATFGALGWAWVMQRRIVAELSHAAQVSAEVARGNLAQHVHSDRSDEIGDLVRSTGHMVGQLRDSLHTVRQASDSIRTAAQEIASGNTDLSQRTEQAASSLQQTASSMEQLTGTVRQTADSARTANQLAASASSVAQRGGAAVQQVVATMDEINRSSHRIADIIGTIDGIAFQTNILALNAAVEAARAGEQGRGFAVVASEVRSLAQRSAAAAREIKGLIQASVEKVDSGTRQVQDAGSTMAEIVASVQRVSDIIGEISSAAGEQSGGIAQVNGAVGGLDQMTQQNAALVEQSAAAAESLREQAARLGDVVNRFQLGRAAAAETPAH